MDSKKKLTHDVESVLLSLHKKLESLHEKVNKLCESSGCFEAVENLPPKKQQKDKK